MTSTKSPQQPLPAELTAESAEFSADEDSNQRNFKDFQVVVNSKNQVVIKNLGGGGTAAACTTPAITATTKKRGTSCSGGSSSSSAGGSRSGVGGGATTPNSKKFNHENYNKSIYIGTKNAERWDSLRTQMKYKNDVEFVTFLLNLVEKYVALNEKNNGSRDAEELNLSLNSRNDFYNHIAQLRKSPTSSMHSSASFLQHNSKLKMEEFRPQDHSITSTMEDFSAGAGDESVAAEILDYRIAEKIENDLKERVGSLIVKLEDGIKCDNLEEEIPKAVVKKKKLKTDGKKGKPKVCWACGQKHEKSECPLDTPTGEVKDKVSLDVYKQICEATKLEKEDEGGIQSLPSYADASCPLELDIVEPTEETRHGTSVIAKNFIAKYTRFGPLIGTEVVESDVVDDSNMRFVFETFTDDKSKFIDVEDRNVANWVHYLRPAPAKDQKNLVMKVIDGEIFFVTCVDINVGCELLYWSGEINSAWTKKIAERMSCGGCNLKFAHPIYYRTHCSIFHDAAFSLTIKKYHCKICKISVLGKENIMKHAETMHDGKGAYQCQFCKKFFLRLNYLDMHRTYGCSANPDRARPLCDFCGRKFCQPQKLKVHIKRMHSDLTDVLRDFQCKMCSKLLGSRAALQRHSKEVHNRESGFVNCPRCQKLFQNRSNLKIHMLTHSGVRPFKCAENECTAAFTTKQCLQFHYKKVHGYTQEQMPKIERSVAYTFDAYSGGLKGEAVDLDEKMFKPRKKRDKSSSSATGEEGTSMDHEALELTHKNEPKLEQNEPIDDDDDDDDYDDATDEENELPKDENELPPEEEKLPEVKRVDETLNLYRDLPSEDEEDNQNSNEDTTINDILETTNQPHPFPFSFAPRPEEPPVMPQTNFNPLTSAFTAHPQSSLLNFFNTSNKNRGGLPTSAMLVEAALNSVSDASNEFIDSVTTEENNIDIESVSKPPVQPVFSDNSVDETDFGKPSGQASISSSGSIDSKKPLDATFNNKKHFVDTFEDDRDFGCRQNFQQPQRDFYHTDNEELNFALGHDYKKYDKCFQYLEEMKNLNETLKEQKRDVLSAESADCHFQSKMKDDLELKFKRKEDDFRTATTTGNFNINTQMYSPLNFKNNEYHEMPTNNSYNRYQPHTIHDILSSSDKEQHSVQHPDELPAYLDHHLPNQQQQQQQQHHYDESLNLCKNQTTDYNSCMSPMPQNYATPQDLCMAGGAGATSGGYMTTNSSPLHHHSSFLNTQLHQHNNPRDLTDHHKFVASRLLVDPRFISEQQHRLLGDMGNVKAEQKTASLGLASLYHQQLPTHQTPYHHEPVKAATNMHANYHHLPFSAYYQ